MEWRDEGIILGARRHGETSAILEIMTRAHGRHLGLVRGGRSRRMLPVLQPGNRVEVSWRARLDEHLGNFAVEPLALAAGRIMESACSVFGMQTLGAHLRLLPERDPYPRLHEALSVVIDHLGEPMLAAELIVRFELLVLEELGFGLDLSECAATGARANLAWVSPKTGRAVSRDAGAPWADRLLPLPAFLDMKNGLGADTDTLSDAFRLSGHFLARHVWEARGVGEPQSRAAFLNAVLRAAAGGKGADAA